MSPYREIWDEVVRYRYREIQEDKGGDIEIQVWSDVGCDKER